MGRYAKKKNRQFLSVESARTEFIVGLLENSVGEECTDIIRKSVPTLHGKVYRNNTEKCTNITRKSVPT